MKNLLLIICCLVFVNFHVHSQDSNSELLKKLVEKNVLTQEEADELMNEQNKDDKKAQAPKKGFRAHDIFSNIPYLKLGGYGMLMYQYREYNPSHHNVSARVIFISARGNITNNLSYFILGELTNPMIYEYYAEWSPIKELAIKGGQFKVPFTLENPISLTNLETVINTRTISALVGMGDDPQFLNNRVNKTGRDQGLQLSGAFIDMGSHNLLQYAAGVFQGEGMNVSDKNNTKDFSGTLAIQPLNGLKVAGGVYAGKATYQKINEIETRSHVRNRWALSAEYTSKDFYARSEWLKGNDGGINKEGLYGTALWYFIPQKMNVIGKVDYFNQDKDNNREVMDYTLGLNYYFFNQCRFTVNYTFSDYSNRWGGKHQTENTVFAQMQIVF